MKRTLLDEMMAAIARIQAKHPCMVLSLEWPTVLVLVGQLQLALRHPANTGDAAETTRGFLDQLFSIIEASDAPLARLMRMGDDPKHDKPC